ncbi:hypothetical protein Cob_v011824 [Colletotrichum orbiculare MAFF 240422]|uniref:Uncharacterized protein n=1 Tax=Colletotrichum orbiculare (strain 104-T / ATCC 96160 / CBS 514.97 / LARS 414 / MAFF 240422) TaxID=1213857 RepID=A0A484FBE0_COLOR|nr:hypothetical protein Cob_v011824 [Colletotrichum orbiculare MAFF 240422]
MSETVKTQPAEQRRQNVNSESLQDPRRGAARTTRKARQDTRKSMARFNTSRPVSLMPAQNTHTFPFQQFKSVVVKVKKREHRAKEEGVSPFDRFGFPSPFPAAI